MDKYTVGAHTVSELKSALHNAPAHVQASATCAVVTPWTLHGTLGQRAEWRRGEQFVYRR